MYLERMDGREKVAGLWWPRGWRTGQRLCDSRMAQQQQGEEGMDLRVPMEGHHSYQQRNGMTARWTTSDATHVCRQC